MKPKHKMFLDELHALLSKYNITGMSAGENEIIFFINGNSLVYDEKFSIGLYRNFNSSNEPKFSRVAVDYYPEDPPELESDYTGDENFDD